MAYTYEIPASKKPVTEIAIDGTPILKLFSEWEIQGVELPHVKSDEINTMAVVIEKTKRGNYGTDNF